MGNIEFDFFANPRKKEGTETNESYHVRISNSQTIDLKEIVRRIHISCSMTPSDVHGVLEALKNEISLALANGDSVNIDGVCRFQLILGSTKSGQCSGKENGSEIGFKRIRISPCKELNEETKARLMPIKRAHGKHSADIPEEDMEKMLRKYLEQNNTITRRQFEELFNLTRYKAGLLIKGLTGKGIIKNIGYKSHPVYTLDKQTI